MRRCLQLCAVLTSLLILFVNQFAHAEASSEEMNKSNSPLTPSVSVNFQDYITSSIYGTDDSANTFLLRGAMPLKIGGLPQIVRATLPYSTMPGINGGTVNGFGDFNIFDIFLAGFDGLELGVGPYLVVPTASKDETGSGKWQIGAAAIAIHPQPWGLLGALLTYQHDFAGDEDRPIQNIFTLQPFVIYNMPYALYLRSTAVWNFNWQTGGYYVPFGIGLGKVWEMSGGGNANLFAEPQWTAWHEGDGYPNFQTFVGLNFQFPLK